MDYNAIAKVLEGREEWGLVKGVLESKIDDLDTVSDIDCQKVDVAVEVRARQHASTILKELIKNLTYTEEKVVDKNKEARIKHGLDQG
jgi:hypothetical protein